jgi:hypothetical protein
MNLREFIQKKNGEKDNRRRTRTPSQQETIMHRFEVSWLVEDENRLTLMKPNQMKQNAGKPLA